MAKEKGKGSSGSGSSAASPPAGGSAARKNRNRRRRQRQRAQSRSGMISAPVAVAPSGQVTQNPMISMSSGGSGDNVVVVSHREYIGDINSGELPFEVPYSVEINPGLYRSFPWLSSMANLYESYLFRKLNFVYEPMVGTTTPGTVILALDYDAADPTPVSKIVAMNFHNAVRSPAWGRSVMVSSKADLAKFGVQRYTRPAPIEANLDIKTYDCGKLFVCLADTPVATLGELYVEYVVELHTPQYTNDLAANFAQKIISGGLTSRDKPFGATPVFTGMENADVRNTLDGTCEFLRPGSYIVECGAVGTGLSAAYPTLTPTDCTISTTGTVNNASVNAGGTYHTATWLVNVLKTGGKFVMDFTAIATTVSAIAMRIAPYKYSYL